ncbi:hypothetical protein BJX76DRAFT_326681 [Aspergillus varians]
MTFRSPANFQGTLTIPGDFTSLLLASRIVLCVAGAGLRPRELANWSDMKEVSAPQSGKASTRVPFTVPSMKYRFNLNDISKVPWLLGGHFGIWWPSFV